MELKETISFTIVAYFMKKDLMSSILENIDGDSLI